MSHFFDFADFAHADLFKNLNYPWEVLNDLENYIKSLELGNIQQATVSPQAYLINAEQIFLGSGTIVEAGAYIKGPCWIGDNSVVRHGAYIRGNVLAGNHVVIGHDTEVKNSIFLTGAQAAHFAYVGDSIIGRKVNLGAGTKCANFKLDKQLITVSYEQKRLVTHRRKLGAIIGDHCQIGCNSVLNPGTLMGKSVRCYPCVNVGGWIPDHSLIKSTHKNLVVPLNTSNE